MLVIYVFRLRVKGSPKTLYEFLETCSGVEAEAYILVNDPQTLVSVIQQAITRNLVVEIIPATQIIEYKREHRSTRLSSGIGDKAKSTMEDTVQVNLLEETSQSKILKKYREKKTCSQKEHKIEEKKEEQKQAKQEETENIEIDTKGSRPLPTNLENLTSMMEKEDELSFNELIRLKEEAFSRKLEN